MRGTNIVGSILLVLYGLVGYMPVPEQNIFGEPSAYTALGFMIVGIVALTLSFTQE